MHLLYKDKISEGEELEESHLQHQQWMDQEQLYHNLSVEEAVGLRLHLVVDWGLDLLELKLLQMHLWVFKNS